MNLTSCTPAEKPVAIVVDTFCTDVPPHHTTDAQREAFTAEPTKWESLVDYLLGIQKVRKKRCSYGGPR